MSPINLDVDHQKNLKTFIERVIGKRWIQIEYQIAKIKRFTVLCRVSFTSVVFPGKLKQCSHHILFL